MKETRRKFRLAIKIISTLIKDCFQYPERLMMDTIVMIARCGVLLVLYWYVFKLNDGVINGTTFIYSAWSIFLYFSFFTLRLHEIAKLIMEDVRTGNVEMLFTKPISYIFYRIWWQIGSGMYSFLVITTFTTIVLGIIIGFPSTMVTGMFFITFILTLALGIVLTLFLYGIIGLLSFWIEDINPIYWIVDKAVMILSGSYLPIALFPPFLYKIAFYSPFGASRFITHTVYESWKGNWYIFFCIQLFWIAIFGVMIYLLFQRAKKKISVNGG